MHYLIYCEDAPNTQEKRRTVRNAHLQHLEALAKQNRLLIAGPWYDQDSYDPPSAMKGSVIIAEFNDIEAAKAWAASDPYSTAEVFMRVTVVPFKRVY